MFRLHLYFFSTVLLGIFPAVSSAELMRSLFQDNDDLIYFALGGGGAYEFIGEWKIENTLGILPDGHDLGDLEEKQAGAGVGMAAIGYAFDAIPIRLEVAYNFIGTAEYKNEQNLMITDTYEFVGEIHGDTDVHSSLIMLNGYLDFIMTEHWAPYIMGGVGFGINSTKFTLEGDSEITGSFEESTGTENTNNFVWNAGFGVNYAFQENFSVGAQIAYVSLGKAQVEGYSLPKGEVVDFLEIHNLQAVTGTVNIAYHF